MNEFIFEDENSQYRFDFSNALWACNNLHDIYNETLKSILSDVDFIVETEEEILLLEYKNSNIEGASNPDSFEQSIKKDKHYLKIARKYYDSLIYLLGSKKVKKYKYVYIIETRNADSVLRKALRNKIAEYLPFKIHQDNYVQLELISDFKVLSIDEWNEEYSILPIKKIS